MELPQTGLNRRVTKARIRDACLGVRDGYSPDRVVADPTLNDRFVVACRAKDLPDPPEILNRGLLNLRKAGGLVDCGRSRRTLFKDQSDYIFASEISVRFLERRDGVTLDDIICAPSRAKEFDEIAARITPGYSALQYRWAALSLRKRRRLKPERVAHVLGRAEVVNRPVDNLDVAEIPASQGVYLFFDSTATLYVGESENLRKRVSKHLEHSDNKGFARWLWECGSESLHIECQILPGATSSKSRKALEAELIESRRPVFNVRRP